MVDHVLEIRSAIKEKPSFYASTHTIPADNLLTTFCFYKEGELRGVDLLNLSHQDVRLLSDACDPATFGVDNKDVLDPSYRKALKMDKENFCTNFELRQKEIGMDIIGAIKNHLWDTADGTTLIRPEIYKLNVYGNDSFFKKHKDTPRGVDMVGSLVVAFPTPTCEGGALVLSKGDKSWTWDSAKILKEAPERTIAYIAFYSDTDHEVLPITEGDRITITYNLYVESDNDIRSFPEENLFKTALANALHDPDFLPDGGYLGFGLHHMYPVDPEETKLDTLMDVLKGSDAMTKSVCESLGLQVELKTVYRKLMHGDRPEEDFVFDAILPPYQFGGGEEGFDISEMGAKMLVKMDADGGRYLYRRNFNDYFSNAHNTIDVLWIIEQAESAEFKTPFIAYGNEHSIGYIYAYICLMAKVDGDKEDVDSNAST